MQKSNLILVKLSLLVIFYFFNYEITKKVTFSVVYFFWKWSKQTLKNVKFTKKSHFEKPNFWNWPILAPENVKFTKKSNFEKPNFWNWPFLAPENVKFTKKSNFEKPNFWNWPILAPEKLYFPSSIWWTLTDIQITFIDQFSKVSHFLFIRTHIKSNTNKMVLKFLRLADEISA